VMLLSRWKQIYRPLTFASATCPFKYREHTSFRGRKDKTENHERVLHIDKS